MPWWKYVANIVLTACANLVTGTRLSEYHSGFRAYSSEVLRRLPLELNADGFVFDTEIILQMKVHGFRITEIPIPTRYFKDASTVGVVQGIHYGIDILSVLMRYVLHRSHLRRSRQFTI